MKKISLDLIIPMHCTGWKATTVFAKEFPAAFALNSVGTKYVLKGEAAAVAMTAQAAKATKSENEAARL